MVNTPIDLDYLHTNTTSHDKARPKERLVMCSSPKEVAEYLAEYWGTYDRQHGYEWYNKQTVIDDCLYGIGAALNPKYRFANGYEQFKKDLIAHLST